MSPTHWGPEGCTLKRKGRGRACGVQGAQESAGGTAGGHPPSCLSRAHGWDPGLRLAPVAMSPGASVRGPRLGPSHGVSSVTFSREASNIKASAENQSQEDNRAVSTWESACFQTTHRSKRRFQRIPARKAEMNKNENTAKYVGRPPQCREQCMVLSAYVRTRTAFH